MGPRARLSILEESSDRNLRNLVWRKSWVLAPPTFELSRRFADRDLQAYGLSLEGPILIRRGEVSEGTALIDEGIAAAVGGELGPVATAVIYCTTISPITRHFERSLAVALASRGNQESGTEISRPSLSPTRSRPFPNATRIGRGTFGASVVPSTEELAPLRREAILILYPGRLGPRKLGRSTRPLVAAIRLQGTSRVSPGGPR